MNKLNRCILTCVLMLTSLVLNAKTGYLEKTVKLPTGKITFKAIFKSLSEQTGCVFSYDPTKVIDSQTLILQKSQGVYLQTALQTILPKNIRYKLNGKYVVLQKVTSEMVETAPVSAPKPNSLSVKSKLTIEKKSPSNTLKLPVNKVPEKADTVKTILAKVDNLPKADTLVIKKVKVDSISLIAIVDDKPKIAKPDSVISPKNVIPQKKQAYLELEASANKQQAAGAIHVGYNNVYAIFSLGGDYNQSYRLGLGAGYHQKVTKHLGVDLELVRNALIAGKSYNLKVRGALTQLTPKFYLKLANTIKLFVGPSVYLSKFRYKNGDSSTVMGTKTGITGIIGAKIDLVQLFYKKK